MKRRFRIQTGKELSPTARDELVKGAILTHIMLQLQEHDARFIRAVKVPASWHGLYNEKRLFDVFNKIGVDLDVSLPKKNLAKVELIFSADVQEPIAVADSSSTIDVLAMRNGIW